MEIRETVVEDWEAIYPIFTHVVATGESYAYADGLSSEAARALWIEEPPGRTVVALEHGAVVGTAKMGPNRPGRGAHVATASFMVAPSAQGHGVGRSLGEHVIEWATDAGYRAIQFNAVVETNVAAVKLWRSLGFAILATVPDAFDHARLGFVGLNIMYRRLD